MRKKKGKKHLFLKVEEGMIDRHFFPFDSLNRQHVIGLVFVQGLTLTLSLRWTVGFLPGMQEPS